MSSNSRHGGASVPVSSGMGAFQILLPPRMGGLMARFVLLLSSVLLAACAERADPPIGFAAECAEDADCADGVVCRPNDWEGCTLTCETDDDCPRVESSEWCHFTCHDGACDIARIDCGEPGRAESAR